MKSEQNMHLFDIGGTASKGRREFPSARLQPMPSGYAAGLVPWNAHYLQGDRIDVDSHDVSGTPLIWRAPVRHIPSASVCHAEPRGSACVDCRRRR